MSFADEFDTQWNSVTAFLESEMITRTQKRAGIDPLDLERKLENEKKRWSVPGQFNYAWLELLRKKNPAVADEFEKALENTRFEQVNAETSVSAVSVFLPVAGGVVIGLAACYIIDPGNILTGIAAIAGGAIGGIIGNGLNQNKKSQADSEMQEQYVKQLKEMQRILRAIVQKADA